MLICPACANENRPGARFCDWCGVPLATASPAAPSREERRVVTVLFADLAGFTSRSESLDPEDVRALLVPYYDALTVEVTAHGGHVDRYLGDGVMALFGAPVAHEDDPERAVLAALRVLERIGALGLDLHARIGINTGPVLFASAGADRDDSVTGDAANTAARLQELAPVDGVVVGEATYLATRRTVVYEALPPTRVKGKAEPVAAFRAIGPRARRGIDHTRSHAGPYVGRVRDLARLEGLFDETLADRAVRLVTVVGEPGIGKSRIVAELIAHARARAPGLTWCEGRCLPYGDGVTFWALGEIVKAHAGILETDDPVTASAKIGAVVPPGPDRDWMRSRLLPLVGVDTGSAAERGELFAAWLGFLEVVAQQAPTVLVFEDIHWADDAMLAFLEHLARHAARVPLLVLATARPELFERHPSFAAGLPGAHRVDLDPLSDEETGRLIAALLGAVVPPEVTTPILERAEGNPLYAQEFVLLLQDRDLLREDGGVVSLRPGATVPLPESIHALLAARLDTLPPDRRAMLADAAVVGKVFWAGAVAAMGGRSPGQVAEAMRDLAGREFVRPIRDGSMAGETEYAFGHVLARDVAYAQLPRVSRAARHEAAAGWLEARAGERVEDFAEVLAHHWATALELERAAGRSERAAAIEGRALRFLTLAGDKAMNLDLATAVATFERAQALAPAGHPDRARLLVRQASAAMDHGRIAESVALYEEAIEALEAGGDRRGALAAMVRLALCLTNVDQVERPERLLDTAIAGLEPEGASEDLASALLYASWLLAGGPRAALLQDRALAMAEGLGLTTLRARAIGHRGLRRLRDGDRSGIDDMRAAMVLGHETGVSRVPATLYSWMTYWLAVSEGPAAALALADEGIGFVRRRGMLLWEASIRDMRSLALFSSGRWAELFEDVAWLRERSDVGGSRPASAMYAAALSSTGRYGEAAAAARPVLDGGGARGGTWGAAVPVIRDLRSRGEAAAALGLLEGWVEWLPDAAGRLVPPFRLWLAREALALDRGDLAARCAAATAIPWAVGAAAEDASLRATLAEADGRFEVAASGFLGAAQAWREIGQPYELGEALLGAGRGLIRADRPEAATEHLGEARGIFGRLGAGPALEEATALLRSTAEPRA